MEIPGEIYKNDNGICFVPDVDVSSDELIVLMKLGIEICSKEHIEDDWKHIGSRNKPSTNNMAFKTCSKCMNIFPEAKMFINSKSGKCSKTCLKCKVSKALLKHLEEMALKAISDNQNSTCILPSRPKYSQTGFNVHMLDEGINTNE